MVELASLFFQCLFCVFACGTFPLAFPRRPYTVTPVAACPPDTCPVLVSTRTLPFILFLPDFPHLLFSLATSRPVHFAPLSFTLLLPPFFHFIRLCRLYSSITISFNGILTPATRAERGFTFLMTLPLIPSQFCPVPRRAGRVPWQALLRSAFLFPLALRCDS